MAKQVEKLPWLAALFIGRALPTLRHRSKQSGRSGFGVEERHKKFSVKEASGNDIAHWEGNLEDFQVTVDQIVDGRCVVCGYDESTCFAVSVTARNRDDRNVSVVAMPKSALNR